MKLQGTEIQQSENIATTSPFKLTDRLSVFSYLVTSNRVRWYRVIMRTFFQRHRELYRYQLPTQEVRDTIREAFDAEYTLEQCQNDLTALKEWGNITTIYDSSRATSIASFLSPALLYQATSEANAIESFLAEQMRASAASGALRQGDLPRLWQSLQLIDEALQIASDKVSAANTQRIMEFLVSQDFQWIMTGPQVSGAGSKIPASARYLMIHEKGSPVATASFWSDSQLDASGPLSIAKSSSES